MASAMLTTIERASHALRRATALLVTAGAGMGVDSRLPDFRGDEGFWKAYPPFRKLGLRFVELANPRWFERDPELAWGFYGHRLALYRRTKPHRGFDILKKWGASMRDGVFVFTSNVDGQFQRAGFDPSRIHECHGSLDRLQCMRRCGIPPFSSEDYEPRIDEESCRAREPLPRCPRCGAMARPNVLLFGDFGWDSRPYDEQEERLNDWLEELAEQEDARLVVVELGAGSHVPTVRIFSESVSRALNGELVRINPRESHGPRGTISIPTGALEACVAIDGMLEAT